MSLGCLDGGLVLVCGIFPFFYGYKWWMLKCFFGGIVFGSLQGCLQGHVMCNSSFG